MAEEAWNLDASMISVLPDWVKQTSRLPAADVRKTL